MSQCVNISRKRHTRLSVLAENRRPLKIEAKNATCKAVYCSRPWSRAPGSRPKTKKIRGQGPTSRGQTLSRPKTGVFEEKDTILQMVSKKEILLLKNCKFSAKSQASSKKKIFINFHEVSGCSKTKTKNGHDLGPFSTNQKIALSSAENRAFRGLAVFEAKDVTFEAKNIKLCPQGLHLCHAPSVAFLGQGWMEFI